jgi:hypothetical protein
MHDETGSISRGDRSIVKLHHGCGLDGRWSIGNRETSFLRSAMARHCRNQLLGRHALSTRSPHLLLVHAHAGSNISEKDTYRGQGILAFEMHFKHN